MANKPLKIGVVGENIDLVGILDLDQVFALHLVRDLARLSRRCFRFFPANVGLELCIGQYETDGSLDDAKKLAVSIVRDIQRAEKDRVLKPLTKTDWTYSG